MIGLILPLTISIILIGCIAVYGYPTKVQEIFSTAGLFWKKSITHFKRNPNKSRYENFKERK
jgi:hypothetical protein